jgi:hypothetical protein
MFYEICSSILRPLGITFMWGDVHKFILDLLVLFVYMTHF